MSDDVQSTDLVPLLTCPTCGPTATEPHPRRSGVDRCSNCKEWLTVLTGAGDRDADALDRYAGFCMTEVSNWDERVYPNRWADARSKAHDARTRAARLRADHNEATTDVVRACRACGAAAYVCEADHVGGGRYIHCRAASAHTFRVQECSSCDDCYHPAFGPNTDGEPCDWCQDCGCARSEHPDYPPVQNGSEAER